ncbi:MAG: sulfite exporter TauE/SafE family protein [Actinomycetota bacterium]
MVEALALVIAGLLTGMLAAALGLGGGVVFVPALVVLFSFDQHLAQGTSLAVILPTAVVATVAHTRMGNVRWKIAAPIALAGVVGAILGAWIALRLNADVLRRVFGVFLIILAIRMAWRAWQLNDRSAPEVEPL